jgi:hypothetical protein
MSKIEPGERAGKNWTESETDYLCENWGTLSLRCLSANLGRSENAVLIKKCKLGLGAFLDSGDYVTFNQLLAALGTGYSYKSVSWVKNRGLPLHFKLVGECSFKVVYLDEFWEWAGRHRNFVDWTKMEENALGMEPPWLKELRRRQYWKNRSYKKTPWTDGDDALLLNLIESQKHTVDEISRRLRRTAGAVERRRHDLGIRQRMPKAPNHNKYKESELRIVAAAIAAREPYEAISDRINRSTKAIRGLVYRYYGTENIDLAAERQAERGAAAL